MLCRGSSMMAYNHEGLNSVAGINPGFQLIYRIAGI